MRQVERHLRTRVSEALNAFRAVVLHGARQSGKTTLAKQVVAERGGTYATLDDEQTRLAALEDPRTFLVEQRHPLAIDEVQLGGDRIVRAVKAVVDEVPSRGRFLLTGSTDFPVRADNQRIARRPGGDPETLAAVGIRGRRHVRLRIP